MKVYRIRHKGTGLYYTPSRGSGNLSKTGKAYVDRKPDIKWTSTIRIKLYPRKKKPTGHHKKIVEYFSLDYSQWSIDKYFQTQPNDWEIVEVN